MLQLHWSLAGWQAGDSWGSGLVALLVGMLLEPQGLLRLPADGARPWKQELVARLLRGLAGRQAEEQLGFVLGVLLLGSHALLRLRAGWAMR